MHIACRHSVSKSAASRIAKPRVSHWPAMTPDIPEFTTARDVHRDLPPSLLAPPGSPPLLLFPLTPGRPPRQSPRLPLERGAQDNGVSLGGGLAWPSSPVLGSLGWGRRAAA